MKNRVLFWLIVVVVSFVAVLVFLVLQTERCVPPPPCYEADQQAGRCAPQPYPCTEM